jgi:hypothetical protein
MEFRLPDDAATAAAVARQWAAARMKPRLGLDPRLGAATAYDDLEPWKSFLDLGLLEAERVGGTLLDEVAGLIEAVRWGQPGPVLETELALATGNEDAASALQMGRIVTSARSELGGDTIVAWGARAAVVVDQATGDTVATSPLPRVPMSHPLPHGRIALPAAIGQDALAPRRWIVGAALLVGLASGAIDLAAEYALERIQFGRPIGDRQAIQLRMAEAHIGIWAGRHAVIDAAWRYSTGRRETTVAAALAWLWTEAAARRASRHCHQVFGAIGFCEELGLVRLTAQIDWLCVTIGRRAAEFAAVRERRSQPSVAHTRVFEAYGWRSPSAAGTDSGLSAGSA